MAKGDSFDPTQLAEYAAVMQNIQAILEDIINKDQALQLTQAQKTDRVREELAAFQSLVELKFKEAQASGQALDNEEKRNLLLQQYRVGLQDQLAKLTTGHYQNQQALRESEAELQRVNDQLAKLSTSAANYQAQLGVLTRKEVSVRQEILRLQSQQIELKDVDRQKSINNITAEMQYADAKVKSSEAAQSAMTMLFGLDNKWRQTLAGSMAETAAAAVRARGMVNGLMESVSNLASTLSNVASFGNVLGSTLMKVQETTITMITQIDRADVGLRSATGASKQFASGLSAAFEDREIKAMAASYDELQAAQSALYSIARAYSGLLPSQRIEMDRAAIAAKRFGISFDDSATIMDKSMRVFGITGPSMLDSLYRSAVAIGETPVRMTQNFIQAIDIMAQYSVPRATQVLQGLSAIAKTTGIEMNTLTSIALRFDTFEDAASNVAKLNAILGGAYFNSVQMLNATESERLHLLRAGLDATNRSWESLGRWERKAVAAAAGFKDMNIAAAFFQGNMAKVEELTKAQERQAEMQGRLIQMGGSVVNIFDQIKRVFQDAGFYAKDLIGIIRDLVGLMKDLGLRGMVTAGLIVGFVNSISSAVVQTRLLAAASGGAATALGTLGTSLIGMAPLLLATGAAWLYFSSKLREEKSPAAFHLPSIAAQGLGAMGENARKAAPAISTLANRINSLNDRRVVSLTRALGMASQISAPNLNFGQVTVGVTELTRAINSLDEKKVNAFSNAMGRLGATMRAIPKENVVAVTQLTKESRMVSALPALAAARTGAQVNAQGSAVRAARASEAPPAGGRTGGMEGVLVTDSITVNVGGTLLTRKIKDTVRSTFERQRNAG